MLQFATGEITAIAVASRLLLNGTNARVADSNDPQSNSALTGLMSVAGMLEVDNGAPVTTGNNLANTGTINVDAGFGDGGSTLTVDGTLTNSGTLNIGVVDLHSPTTVTAQHLVNGGAIKLDGGGASDTNRTALYITAEAAPTTLTGDIEVHDDALVAFASGEIGSIGSKSKLVVDGANAFIADAGSTDSNSALTSLSSISGVLEVDDGGSVVVDNNLANSGTINVDANFGVGGSGLTVNGTLTNSGLVAIGATPSRPTAPTTVTVTHLVNSGSIRTMAAPEATPTGLPWTSLMIRRRRR